MNKQEKDLQATMAKHAQELRDAEAEFEVHRKVFNEYICCKIVVF